MRNCRLITQFYNRQLKSLRTCFIMYITVYDIHYILQSRLEKTVRRKFQKKNSVLHKSPFSFYPFILIISASITHPELEMVTSHGSQYISSFELDLCALFSALQGLQICSLTHKLSRHVLLLSEFYRKLNLSGTSRTLEIICDDHYSKKGL